MRLISIFIIIGTLLMVEPISAAEKIKLCPATPNCVSSLPSEDASKKIESFKLNGNLANTQSVLKDIIQQMPRTQLIEQTDNYLHFTFTSLIFRFVDDVEFEFNENENKMHVRSASRVGRSDLGVNANRIAEIRRLYDERLSLLGN